MAKTKEELNLYHNEYRKRKRRERGLMKPGRKEYTEEQKQEAKIKRKQWEKNWKKQYYENSPQKRLLWAAKRRAKSKGLKFDLEESDIIIPKYCPYLGIELVISRPRGDSRRDIASLDRIDNSKGYIKGNVEVISWLANSMKSNATINNLLSFAREVIKRYE